jgi:hypothetical protein
MDEDAVGGGEGLEFRNQPHHHHHHHHHHHIMGDQPADDFMPIELRQLESTDFVELFQLKNEGMRHNSSSRPSKGMLFSNVLYPRR